MRKEDPFKKRREALKKRKHDFRTPKANSYLIVTEGKCTEPNYLNGLKEKILANVGGTVEVIDICGEGASTQKLIEITEMHENKAKIPYQYIWVVFDKDDFRDFDQAIKEGEEKGYHVAWSNQSFEYWIYLHFNYSDANLHRKEWKAKLDELFKSHKLSKDGYGKNIENLFELLDSFCGVRRAIDYAKKRMADFDSKKDKPSKYAPGTTVHILVEELLEYLKD
jgi:hypothetical protein